jgi:hypothetical protein
MSAALTDADLARRAAALAARAERPPPQSWLPENPDEGHPAQLVGELVRVEDNYTRFGPCKIAILRDPAGVEWSVWLIRTVLRSEFEKQRPRVGDVVLVKYQGKVSPKGGGDPYHGYELLVDRDETAGADVGWGAVEPSAGFGEAAAGTVGASAAAAPVRCDECGYAELDGHAPGCSNDPDGIPF